MADKLCVAVIGNRNSGKSTTWQQLFGGKVKGGYHELQLYYGDYAKVFLVGSSPQEQKTPINQLLGAKRPRIVLCAIQYSFDAHETLTFFSDNGYQIFAHWLNPGYKDNKPPVLDPNGIVTALLSVNSLVGIRDGKISPYRRVQNIKDFVS